LPYCQSLKTHISYANGTYYSLFAYVAQQHLEYTESVVVYLREQNTDNAMTTTSDNQNMEIRSSMM